MQRTRANIVYGSNGRGSWHALGIFKSYDEALRFRNDMVKTTKFNKVWIKIEEVITKWNAV